MASRASKSKRRGGSQDNLHVQPLHAHPPATPPPSNQPASTPTARLKKRSSYGWPLKSSAPLRGGTNSAGPDVDQAVKREASSDSVEDTLGRDSGALRRQTSFTSEFKASENMKPSKPRPRSTMSSLKTTGSALHTPRTDSPSFSYSNRSTAPILPILGEPSPPTLTRNRLVKRSSSQRISSRDSHSHSALRRPATSHQRSATLQRGHLDGEESIRRRFHTSSLPYDLPEHHQSFDDCTQRWRPFFQPYAIRQGKHESTKKRSRHGGFARHESPPTIVPGITELPTLMLATSISTRSSDDASNGLPRDTSALSTPFAPTVLNNFDTPTRGDKTVEPTSDSDARPRSPLSLSDIFPSPSPLSWKMPHVGSLRKKRSLRRDIGSRRVVSAPHSVETRVLDSFAQGDRTLGTHTRIFASPDNEETASKIRLAQNTVFPRSPSSPLPPLNRFSAFEVDLPDIMPSYSTGPHPLEPRNPPRRFSAPSTPPLSHLASSLRRNQAHHPSGTYSDHASTLLGSDNDNSRFVSGDEDDVDCRSETVYDSARTGGAGSSTSKNKRRHIDTVFDESSLPVLTAKDKLVSLQSLHVTESVTADDRGKDHVAEQNDRPLSRESKFLCKEPKPLASTQGRDKFSDLPEPESLPPTMSSDLEIASMGPSGSIDSGTGRLSSSDDTEKLLDDSITPQKTDSNNMDDTSAWGSSRSRKSNPRRRESPPPNPFEWSEQAAMEKESPRGDPPRPKTVHGRQGKELRGSRLSGRRGPPALHLRSQSVPVPSEPRNHSNASKLDSWVLGNKGPSEEWDGDFDFEDAPRTSKPVSDGMRPDLPSGMLVPRAILERQASVHGQFGQVKELTKLVEELRRLQQQARLQGIMNGQSAELWKEAEGIINLATVDDEEQEVFPPHSPIADFDFFDDDTPSSRRRKSEFTSPRDEPSTTAEDDSSQASLRLSHDRSNFETPPHTGRPRKQSSAKAKSVLENIHQQRAHYDPVILDAKITQKKLPFDTTSLKDLVTRAGVVTRALKEEVRRAENRSESPSITPDHKHEVPPDPPFSQMFQKPPISPSIGKSSRESKSSRVTQSPNSPANSRGDVMGASMGGNDNDINGHMKMMTVV
ncbi:MAG: hypothetical protein Q9163_003274 [Psora crenata]